MRHSKTFAYALGGVSFAIAAALFIPSVGVVAADHLDPPGRVDPGVDSAPDLAADIADIYAWHTDDSVIIALTFSGPQATDQAANYDPDVLYSINISNSAPRTATDIPIQFRFGTGTMDQFGIQVMGIPGIDDPIEGSVETLIEQDGVKIYAGLFDDPFFFDLQGFRDTLNTGDLSFDSNRDFFAGQNLTAVVIEIPRDRIDAGELLDIWGSTARLGGQL